MKLIFLFILVILSGCGLQSESENERLNGQANVRFKTTDTRLQELYDRAEWLAKKNITDYGGRKVMVEGARYVSVWLETQPMAGYMYAKRNMEIGRNNIEIFLDNQREDGRLPGVIYNRNGKVEPNYCQFQGLCMPVPAYELYFLLGRDTAFLQKLYHSLEGFDAYLWKTRDSDNNGCLETWCMYDTGEDHCSRFNGFPNAWAFDYPPDRETASKLSPEELKTYCKEDSFNAEVEMTVPIESMDVMSYSYTCRDVLSLISGELGNGLEQHWRNKAEEVKAKLRTYLWDDEKSACYDRDKNNEVMPVLLHNNLRCMYYGSFDQDMADRFTRYHLLNPEEFWTPMPLPSIAANDPEFRNIPGNNWSGQPQGLTYQRSIQALENYGHFAELTILGRKFLEVLGDSLKFTQQFDPFTAKVNSTKDGYGPSILASLEFISRFYGIHISQDRIYWSCLTGEQDYDYTQEWMGNEYRLRTEKAMVKCFLNGSEMFSFSKGVRIISDLEGRPLEVVGIEPQAVGCVFKGSYGALTGRVEPNRVYRPGENGELISLRSVDFYPPE